MSKSVIIIGAGGHGKVVADIISSSDIVLGFLDDEKEKGTDIVGFKVLGKINDYVYFPDAEYIIAIGNQKKRKSIAENLPVKWYTAIHPKAIVSNLDVEIGEGTVVMANAVVNPSTKIGKHCIINTGSVVEHDNRLGDYVHISPNVTLSGAVTVGESSHIGTGVSTKQLISIAANCIIGVGSAVVENITESGVYAGTPARRIK